MNITEWGFADYDMNITEWGHGLGRKMGSKQKRQLHVG